MPYSTDFFKNETYEYIARNFQKNIRILDVGPGVGRYADALIPLGYTNIDCIEVFEQYINDYKLRDKYKNVYHGDITEYDLDLNSYDLIIFGDVIEHIEVDKAQKLLSKIDDNKVSVIVAVPFLAPQGEHCGNKFEIHLQADLTYKIFLERFKNYTPFCVRYDFGVFLNKNILNSNQNIFYIDLPEDKKAELTKEFPDKQLFDVRNLEKEKEQKKNIEFPVTTDDSLTFVTGLWNLGRGDIGTSFVRDYKNYLDRLENLLKAPVNMYIFVDKADEEFIWKHRSKENTVVNNMSLEELEKWFPFTEMTDKIRQDPNWLAQAGWLPESTQARLKMYNPLVMSKMFMLNNVSIWNPFHSKYFYWIDAGLTGTVHPGYFTHDKVHEKLSKLTDKFLFISFPYPDGGEIHGFERSKMNDYANVENVDYVCRGGFFGGHKKNLAEINGLYYSLLNATLSEGYMGTEESIFTLMTYQRPELFHRHMIESNGLVGKFFEDLKNMKEEDFISVSQNYSGTSLYVITFNSPEQFNHLCETYAAQPGFLKETKNYLLDNSTDLTTTQDYLDICKKFNFEHIKKENVGICGGRQFIAEHFEQTDSKYYIFLEDDMNLCDDKQPPCKCGFARYTNNLFYKILKIMNKENFDFLKLCFTEFFGDNTVQWSWYNVPQTVREQFWPNKTKLPKIGLDPNAPKTLFKNINTCDGLSYISGEIYYCNWPQIVSREGNTKMFLDTKWTFPYEQTWMSHIYQLTKANKIKPGLLLLSPIEHHRFAHYAKELRREN